MENGPLSKSKCPDFHVLVAQFYVCESLLCYGKIAYGPALCNLAKSCFKPPESDVDMRSRK